MEFACRATSFKLRTPVLLLWGGRDLIVPVHQARHAARRLVPPGGLQIVPGAGHLPQVERSAEFVAALAPFLAAAAP